MKHSKKLIGIALLAAGLLPAAAIPAGTEIRVRTTTAISSEKVKAGDHWSGTLDSDLRGSDGATIGKKGDSVDGLIMQARPSGRLSDPGYLSLSVVSVAGQTVSTDNYVQEGGSHKKRNAAAVGGTAIAGALIGGLAGGGKGAAIGAGAGAGAGAAGAAATGKKEAVIPSETVLKFTVN